MLLSAHMAHRKWLLLGRHELDARPDWIGLWLLLLLALWLTCVHIDEVGHEPLHGQYVLWVLLFFRKESLM